MRTLRDVPIKQKLLVVIVVTSGVALMVSGVAIVALDSVLFRATMQRDLTALASIVGDNSTAALAFDDPRVAAETLAALRARQHMVAACIYGGDGRAFARYTRPGTVPACPPPAAREQIQFTSKGLTASHPIVLNGRRIGTLVLLYDLGEITERIRSYSGIVLVILLASSLIAFVLSSRLRAIIATPIARLARAAGSVSESGDYSVRVEKDSGDELGVLVEAFNAMLERTQVRDTEVQNARNLLQTTLTSIGDAVISTDIEGRIVFANPVALSLLGWPEPEITGKPIGDVFQIINEFSRMKVESPVDRVLREGVIVGLANHSVLIARDGTEVPIDDSAAPIKQGGRTIGVVLVFRDISERRRAQQDAAYLASIVESSDDAIIGKSPGGIIQSWNSGAERLYGYKAEEIIGHSMVELLPADRQHEESDVLERLRGDGRVVHFETVRVRKNGAPIDVLVTVSPIRDRTGQIVGISHVARDITEHKRNAEQMRQTQRLESLGVLAGGIAHDFNNLLTGILGNASLALDDLTPGSPLRAPIESVIAASEQAAQLARQMLAYSGKGRFVLEHIDLSERVRATLPLIKAAIPPTVELRLNLDEHLPVVEADAAQVQQFIMNVIINGAEAIPEGAHGTVTIITRREQVGVEGLPTHEVSGARELAPGPYVVFEVSDTGSGMDEDTQARIFDPFFTTKFTGRGLGLAAVLGIVRGHQGSVQVLSTLGKGTLFRVMLPATEGVRKAKPVLQETQAKDLRGGGMILVVDDEQVVRNMAKQTLERYGYSVLLAEDGARGLDVFRREAGRIKCVVLDLTMPVMSGEETLSRMKAIRSEIPVILSSGFNEVQAVRRFEGKGLAGFLQKPYKAAVLAEVIRGIMGRGCEDPSETPTRE
jgi:PAS domain S-box-containing protein